MEGSDAAAIRSAVESLQKAASEFGTRLYQGSQAGGPSAGPGPQPERHEEAPGAGAQDSNGGRVYDAEYEVVDDERKAG